MTMGNSPCIGPAIDMLPASSIQAAFHRSSLGPHCVRPGATPWTGPGPWSLHRHLPEMLEEYSECESCVKMVFPDILSCLEHGKA